MKIKSIASLVTLFVICSISCSSLTIMPPSPTQTPTQTNAPTSTLVPTNTPLPTNTTTPIPSTALEKQADGTWRYSSREAGFEFRLGKNWYLEDVSSLSLVETIDRTSKITTELGIKNTPQYSIEPQGMLVLGVYRDETIPDYLSSAFNAAHIQDDGFANMSLEDIQNRVIEILAQTHNRDPKTFESKLAKNESGVEYSVIFFNLALNYYQMKIIFKLEDGMGLITFGFSENNIDTFGPDWALLTSSLKYTSP